ncbi:MAG: oxidoreductase, partial [Burkholderiales bacterium]|nr:oxidoreductase [Burkholderiales bacterium]
MSGRQDSHSFSAELSATVFLIQQMLGRVCTATLAQVKAVSNNGGVTPVGTVTIQPLVNQVDGSGNTVAHGLIYNVPYFRLQGGANAVILDPEIGDIGIAVFADHDISSVKSTKAAANPGSGRRFDMSDALYLGGFLGGAPSQYVQFDA